MRMSPVGPRWLLRARAFLVDLGSSYIPGFSLSCSTPARITPRAVFLLLYAQILDHGALYALCDIGAFGAIEAEPVDHDAFFAFGCSDAFGEGGGGCKYGDQA